MKDDVSWKLKRNIKLWDRDIIVDEHVTHTITTRNVESVQYLR